MYQPDHFKLDDLAALHDAIRAHPLGQLVTSGPGGLIANPVPFLLKPDGGPKGALHCHLARPNPQWREIEAGAEVLVLFMGREGYVTPSWYASKKEHGKVVPTWNYVAVQARGRARVIADGEWLVGHVAEITDGHEQSRERPWAISDAPDGYIPALARGIVGVEIEITELTGKFKMSQNRPEADRHGVAEGMTAEGQADMAALVRELGRARP